MQILFLLAAYFSEVVGTLVGFGSSTIFLPLALLLTDFRPALILAAFLHIFGNLGRIGFFKHGLEWGTIIKFGIPSVIFSFVGALFVPVIPQSVLKTVLGGFLIFYAAVSLIQENFKINPTLVNMFLGGGVSGFVAGLIGTGGAIRGAFLTGFGLTKDKYIATAALIALAVDIVRIPVYFAYGFLEGAFYWYIPALFVIALIGSFTGKKIVDKIPQRQFKRLVLVAIALIGIKLVLDGVS